MTQYKNVNEKRSNSQLDKLKSAIKNTKVTVELSWNVIVDHIEETNFSS